MNETLLSNFIWAMPVLILSTLLGLAFAFAKTGFGRWINWDWVDFIWIATSAVTLYFLATGIIFEQNRNEAQIELNNYTTHVRLGRQAASTNLEEFCIGSTPRTLAVSDEATSAFCSSNSQAFHRFSQAALAYQNTNTITRFNEIRDISNQIFANEPGPDAVLAKVRLSRVYDEAGWLNQNAEHLLRIQNAIAFPNAMKDLRILWIYLFALIIGLRWSKAVFEIWFSGKPPPKPRKKPRVSP